MSRDQLFAMSEADATRLLLWGGASMTLKDQNGKKITKEDEDLYSRLVAWRERQSKPVMIRGD